MLSSGEGTSGAEEIAYYDPAYWEFGRYADVLREHNIASGNVWFEDFVLDAEDRIVPTGPTGDPTDGPFGEIACQGLKLLRDVVMHHGRFAVHLLERGYAVDHRNVAGSGFLEQCAGRRGDLRARGHPRLLRFLTGRDLL